MKFSTQLKKLGTETAFAVSAEAAKWRNQGNKVFPFHLGDLNFATPQNIVEATVRAIADKKTGYCPPQGILPLRESLADDVGFKRKLKYNPENIAIQPGGKPTIGKFFAAIMNPGDEVLYPNPGYPIYESQIEFQNGVAVPYSYVQSTEGFDIDLDRLRNSITKKTIAIVYNNYQNPISAQSSQFEMESIAKIAIENNLWVLSDDAYFEMSYDGESSSIASIPGMVDRTVILYTFSKKYAMTGWRLGGSIGPKKIIDIIAKLNSNAESCTTHFIQEGGIEALKGDQSEADEILKTLKDRRDLAVSSLNRIDGIEIPKPKSTFYLFPNINTIMKRKNFTSLEQLRKEALEQCDVSFCTRNHFSRPQDHEKDFFIRFAYSGISENDISEGLRRLKIYFETP